MKFFGKRWSTSASYERWIYNLSETYSSYATFKNSLTLTGSFNSKYFYGSLDYSYLFGSQNAHRLIGSLSGYLNWKKVWIFDRVKVLPSVSVIFGNNIVTTIYSGDLREAFRQNEYLRENLQSPEFRQFIQSALTDNERNLIQQIKNNRNLSIREKTQRITAVYLSNSEVDTYIRQSLAEGANEYGLMNYSFSLPVLFSIKNFTWSINYTYSVPINLPGETADLSAIGYLSTSLSFRIPLR